MVDQVCKEIPDFLPGVEMDHYQIMPNHFHGIIVLNPIDFENGYEPTVGADLRVALFEPCLPLRLIHFAEKNRSISFS